MPTYISLVEYTQDGIENIHDSADRLNDAKSLAKEHGGEITAFYLTMGRFDIVTITEFRDDESYAKFALSVAREGNVSTETLKAFSEDEFREIIGAFQPMESGPGGHTLETDGGEEEDDDDIEPEGPGGHTFEIEDEEDDDDDDDDIKPEGPGGHTLDSGE